MDDQTETLAILTNAGALETDVRCHAEGNWTVGAAFPFDDGAAGYPHGKPYWGNTARLQGDGTPHWESPQHMARHIVEQYEADKARFAPAPANDVAAVEPVLEGADMAAPSVNINVNPVFNVTGGNATSDQKSDAGSDAEARAIREAEALFGDVNEQSIPERSPATPDASAEEGAGIVSENIGLLDGDTEPALAGTVDAAAATNPEELIDVPIPESEAADPSPEAIADHVDSGADDTADDAAEDVGDASAGPASGGLQVRAVDGQDEPSDSDLPYAVDADYEEIGDDTTEALALEAAAAEPEPPEHDRGWEQPAGGVVYFGDDIHVARLMKLGRLAEIAREQKAVLQEGWTVEEFASLQNLMVRVERGEATKDDEAHARFLAINERSRAMSAVDAYQNSREDELESYAQYMKEDSESLRKLGRDSITEFDPEFGWP